MKGTNDGLKTVFVKNRNQRRFDFNIHCAKLDGIHAPKKWKAIKVFTFCAQTSGSRIFIFYLFIQLAVTLIMTWFIRTMPATASAANTAFKKIELGENQVSVFEIIV
jgi:hypothetical protein